MPYLNAVPQKRACLPGRCVITDIKAVQHCEEKNLPSAVCPPPYTHSKHTQAHTQTQNVLKQIPSAYVNTTFTAAVLIPHNPQRI